MLSQFDQWTPSLETRTQPKKLELSARAVAIQQRSGRAAVEANGSKANRSKGLRATGWLPDG